MYRPSSTVYPETNVGDDLAEKFVTASAWDSSQPSGRSKEVRPFDRHSGPMVKLVEDSRYRRFPIPSEGLKDKLELTFKGLGDISNSIRWNS